MINLSKAENLFERFHRLFWVLHGMPDCSAILEDFIVVPALVCLVAKEVNGGVVNTADLLLLLNVLQTIRLIPAGGEDIEGDLTSNAVAV